MLGEISGESWQEEYNMVKWRESRNHFWGGRVLLEHAAEGARIKLTPARSMKAQCGW